MSYIQFAPWSPSKAGCIARCPLSFKYKYIDKVEQGPKSAVSKIGTTVHRALELMSQTAHANTKIAALLNNAITDVGSDLTHTEIERVKAFADCLISFKTKLQAFTAKHPVDQLLLEQAWAITENFEPCDFSAPDALLRGVVDLGLLLKSGHLIVIDHKSGRVRPLTEYGVQLDVYAIMGHARYPDTKGIQCAVNFIAHDIITWNKPQTPSHVLNVLRPWLLSYLTARAKTAEGFRATPGYHCKWCDVRSICIEHGAHGSKTPGTR